MIGFSEPAGLQRYAAALLAHANPPNSEAPDSENRQWRKNVQETKSSQTLRLSDLKTGDHACFLEVQGGKEIAGRLTSLGFTPGVDIVMTQNFGRGPLVVILRGTRVALGREEARKISVIKDF